MTIWLKLCTCSSCHHHLHHPASVKSRTETFRYCYSPGPPGKWTTGTERKTETDRKRQRSFHGLHRLCRIFNIQCFETVGQEGQRDSRGQHQHKGLRMFSLTGPRKFRGPLILKSNMKYPTSSQVGSRIMFRMQQNPLKFIQWCYAEEEKKMTKKSPPTNQHPIFLQA